MAPRRNISFERFSVLPLDSLLADQQEIGCKSFPWRLHYEDTILRSLTLMLTFKIQYSYKIDCSNYYCTRMAK